MAVTQLSDSLDTIAGLITPLGILLSVVCAILWIVYATGSIDVLRRRAWQLAHGNAEVLDPDIKGYLEERASMLAFRFRTGIRVRTPQQARQVIKWLRDHDEDATALRRTGSFFDPEFLSLDFDRIRDKKPMLWGGMLFALLAASGPLYRMMEADVFLTVKRSGTWFAVNPQTLAVRTVDHPWLLSPGQVALSPSLCAGDYVQLARRSGFSLDDVGVICRSVTHPDSQEKLPSVLSQQQYALLALAIVMFVAISASPFQDWMRWRAASNLQERLGARQARPGGKDFAGPMRASSDGP